MTDHQDQPDLPPARRPAAILATEAELGAGPAEPRDDEVSAASLSLFGRLRQPRTLASLAIPIVLLVLLARALPGYELDRLPGFILGANPWLLVGALLIYYVSFPLRGYRWSRLLKGSGEDVGTRDATEILFISWLVNCLVPAKLGDIYRGYLLRLNRLVSLSRTLGTIFIERIFDLFAIAILGLAAGFWSFRNGFDPFVQFVLGLGVVVVVILAAGLFTLRNFGRRILGRLPLPHAAVELYDRFEQGVFSLPTRQLPRIGVVTALIWGCESMRLFLVVAALGFGDLHMGISGVFFVALAASLLTAVPLTPGGLGVVEAGMVTILTLVYGVPQPEAAAITVVDRALSVLSVVIFGSILYIVSDKTRGLHMRPRIQPTGKPASSPNH
jgi:uncharacterized protein (TIRG00374 family)